nr:ORF9 [Cnaphalocrocis medinalis granulovirus]
MDKKCVVLVVIKLYNRGFNNVEIQRHFINLSSIETAEFSLIKGIYIYDSREDICALTHNVLGLNVSLYDFTYTHDNIMCPTNCIE